MPLLFLIFVVVSCSEIVRPLFVSNDVCVAWWNICISSSFFNGFWLLSETYRFPYVLSMFYLLLGEKYCSPMVMFFGCLMINIGSPRIFDLFACLVRNIGFPMMLR